MSEEWSLFLSWLAVAFGCYKIHKFAVALKLPVVNWFIAAMIVGAFYDVKIVGGWVALITGAVLVIGFFMSLAEHCGTHW